ncbi:MAG TPA: purine-nucleoside phosphorylase [Polyangiaceae bacterium]|nr:purine-nucleoside phosphorylase [Polyangiaceae bacterium]
MAQDITNRKPPRPELRAALEHLGDLGDSTPRVGVVLGSGLGSFADQLSGLRRVPYTELAGMPQPAVSGHAGNLCLGRAGEVPVACLQGRVHLYEGHPVDRVVLGVRLLVALGCEIVLLTNAAGGIGEFLRAGDLMLITDHINLSGANPLVGPLVEGRPRFPDMTLTYCPELRAKARDAAGRAGVELAEGVYAGMLGPSYETPAEVRMLGLLGAHAVGMSTVPEVIALREEGARVGAVSCITNLAAGRSGALLDHAEVEAVASEARERFARFLSHWIELAARVEPA